MAEIKFKVTLETIIKSDTNFYNTNSKMEMAEIEKKNLENDPLYLMELINLNGDIFKIIVKPI